MKGARKMKRMTRREQAVYDYVLLFRAKMRFSPSMREIAEGIGLNSVSYTHLTLPTKLEV